MNAPSLRFVALAILSTLGVTSAASAQPHAGDLWIGHSAPEGGRLCFGGFAFRQFATVLPPIGSFLTGWFDNNPGIDHAAEDDPDNDLYVIQPGAELWLEVVALDPGFKIYSPSWQLLDEAGESFHFADGHLFHVHPKWFIDAQEPCFICYGADPPPECETDPPAIDCNQKAAWRATLVLRDEGTTAYEPSPPFTLVFSNDPDFVLKPGDLDLDGSVNLADFATFAICYGRSVSVEPGGDCSPADAQACDLDASGTVDLQDFATFAVHFGS